MAEQNTKNRAARSSRFLVEIEKNKKTAKVMKGLEGTKKNAQHEIFSVDGIPIKLVRFFPFFCTTDL
jgi:hypothetical protein